MDFPRVLVLFHGIDLYHWIWRSNTKDSGGKGEYHLRKVIVKINHSQLVTIIYAILGIPLFFLCLGHIGETLSRTFRFLYWKVCCVMCTSRKKVFNTLNCFIFIIYNFKVRRRCRTSIRAPGRLGPRQSLKFRDNMSLGGRSPRLQRRYISRKK